jgi:hypothetical protein
MIAAAEEDVEAAAWDSLSSRSIGHARAVQPAHGE